MLQDTANTSTYGMCFKCMFTVISLELIFILAWESCNYGSFPVLDALVFYIIRITGPSGLSLSAAFGAAYRTTWLMGEELMD